MPGLPSITFFLQTKLDDIEILSQKSFTNTFFYGTLSEKTAYAPWIAIAFICFGVAECLGSIIIGKGNDVLGRRPMLYVTLFLHALAIIVSFEPIFLLSGRARIDNSSGEGTIITEGFFLLQV